MKNLYNMTFDCGRMDEVEGRFFATPEEIEALTSGKEVHFGEVLGKHSDISGPITKDEIKLVTDNQEFISEANRLGIDLESGYDPLCYYTCKECGKILNIITDKCDDENCGKE